MVASLLEALSVLAAHALHPLMSRACQGTGLKAECDLDVVGSAASLMVTAADILKTLGSSLPLPLLSAPGSCDGLVGDSSAMLPEDDSVAGSLTDCILCYTSLAAPFIVQVGRADACGVPFLFEAIVVSFKHGGCTSRVV